MPRKFTNVLLRDKTNISIFSLELILEPLLQNYLLESKVAGFSIPASIQAKTFKNMSGPERKYFFDTAVQSLFRRFPYTSDKDIGHQFAAWKRCEVYVSHVDHLKNQVDTDRKFDVNTQPYSELLLRVAW